MSGLVVSSGSPARRTGRSPMRDPVDRDPHRLARYNGKPQDPLLALPKR